jgi:hypothetical protein
VWGNAVEIDTSFGTPLVTFTNIRGGYGQTWFGTGCIDADPLWVNPDGPDGDPATWQDNDYHLSASSPCLNAGNPQTFGVDELDMDGEPRVMAGRVDMGADEFTGRPFVFGDLNCDGVRDAFDIDPFILALTDPVGYAERFAICNILNADCNTDAVVNAFDIDPFIALLTAE